ncbi:FG-GAP-like repeat-containing protein [Phycicoccus sp.]|uniref:FG-GAP-like repeat-containing protein n=1 Tax=Phycicoccus sp. TaxID=1902410 RepID=UPI002D0575B8|nr:FG-GAP-like repeat-containing protein [Phycicoccus sp.]HMM95716.1 N-acetylmuramoyl-L-alanine amidase [Phycicoccus sp.]
MRRFLAVLATTVVFVVTGVVATGGGAQAAPRPVPPAQHTAPLAAPPVGTPAATLATADRTRAAAHLRATARDVRVVSASQEVSAPDGPRVVGLTWSGPTDGLVVEYRTRTGSGEWSGWQETEADDHGPDPGTGEGKGERPGSDPIAVGTGTSVQVRALGTSAQRTSKIALTVVDPGSSPADQSVGTAMPGAAGAAAARPVIYTRAQWGADERLRNGPVLYAGVKAAVVHHTVNSNSYSAADVPALIRGIYAFHVNGRGWSDIGYNFIIDRFGRIWEGRYGGMDRAVVGAHSLGVNSWTTGIATLGDFTTATAPPAVISAYQRLIAWKAQIHQFDPAKTANLAGKIRRGVSGHRDVYSTECPGNGLYRYIPTIAAGASPPVRGLPSLTVGRDTDNNGDNDIVLTNDSHDLLLAHAQGGQIQAPERLAAGSWRGVDSAISVGDWNGDRVADLMARSTSTGDLLLYRGNGVGSLQSALKIGHGWQAMSRITGVNDLTGDGYNDVVAVDGANALRIYAGTGSGRFQSGRVIGTGWSGIRLIVGVGDWDGNGVRDVLGVTTSGTAVVYRWAGSGLRTLAVLPGDWSQYASVTALGDATGDTRVDVLGVDASGVGTIISSTGNPAQTQSVPQSRSFAGYSVYTG